MMSKSNHHYAYVKFKKNTRGIEGIISYYCDCQTEARTIGKCSHVTATLVWLGMKGNNAATMDSYEDFIINSANIRTTFSSGEESDNHD